MLDALRFVASAVAKKSIVSQELTHFKIRDGRVTGFNGVIALSTDIDVDLDIQPHAAKLIAAVKACPGTIALNMTAAGKLAVRSGAFKSFVDCLPDDAFNTVIEPEGESINLGPGFMDAIKAIAPIMSVDDNRPWFMGIKLRGASAYATNNVMLAEYWHGTALPFDVVIPAAAINELLRLKEPPTRVQMTTQSMSFWFGEKRWLRTALIEGDAWPTDRMGEILDASTGAQQPIPAAFPEAIDKLKTFVTGNGAVYLSPERISTALVEDDGTSIAVPLAGIDGVQAYSYHQLTILAQVAETIGWSSYPNPCMFRKGPMRGVIVGIRI